MVNVNCYRIPIITYELIFEDNQRRFMCKIRYKYNFSFSMLKRKNKIKMDKMNFKEYNEIDYIK